MEVIEDDAEKLVVDFFAKLNPSVRMREMRKLMKFLQGRAFCKLVVVVIGLFEGY